MTWGEASVNHSWEILFYTAPGLQDAAGEPSGVYRRVGSLSFEGNDDSI